MKPFSGLARTLMFCLPLAGLTAPLQASEVEYALGQGANFRYYGWLHFASQMVDDGVGTTSNIVDVTNAASRFGFYITPTDAANPLSFQFETSLGFRPSDKTSQNNTPEAWNWTRGNLRKVQVIVETGVGTFRLGQGSMTMDGVAESDLGGTVIVAKSTIPESYGSFVFRTEGGALSGVSIGDTFSNLDGPRKFRLRFDTKKFSGFSLAGAYGQEVLKSGDSDDYSDLALRYQGSIGAVDIKGALGTSFINANRTATAGSLSLLHRASGLNLSFAAGQRAGSAGQYMYVKAGWNGDILAVGQTKFIIEGFRGDDYVTAQARSVMWGLAVIQELDAQSMEIYAGYRGFSYEDATPATYRDIDAVQIGARWRF